MSLTKQNQNQQITPQSQGGDEVGYIEESKKSTKASASAGVNLNVFGAIAGAFSSKSKKSAGDDDGDDGTVTTRERSEGKRIESAAGRKEEKYEQARIQGAGQGNMNANAAGAAEQNARQKKEVDA